MTPLASLARAFVALLLLLASACGGEAADSFDSGVRGRSAAELQTRADADDHASLRMAYIRARQGDAGPAYALMEQGGALVFDNRRHNLSARFVRGEFAMTDRADEAAWSLSVTVDGFGCRDELEPLDAAESTGEGNRIEQQHGELTAWYLNGPLGIEQGFEVPDPPACLVQEGRLTIAMTVEGLQPRLDEPGQVVLENAAGLTILRVHDLYVTDADGAELAAALAVDEGRLFIDIGAADAAFPLAIDPLWSQQAKLMESGEATAGDQLGFALSVSGDTALVGAVGDDGVGNNSGAAYVFVRSGTSWTEQQKLTASDAAEDDLFGGAVSVDVNTALVGARSDDDGGTFSGSAYVFVRSGTSWTEQQKLTASDAAAGDFFGASVSLSGDTALVGAHYDDDGGSNSGSAYVFVRSGMSWSQHKNSPPPTPLRTTSLAAG